MSDDGKPKVNVDRLKVDVVSDNRDAAGNGHVATLAPEDAVDTHLPTPEELVAAQEKTGFRALLHDAANWRELRKTPYGVTPAIIIALVLFFQVLDTAAFAVAGPDIVREFDIEIGTILRLRQLVGFVAIFAALGLAWYADRARRVPLYAIGTIGSGLASMATAGATSVLTLGVPRVLDEVTEVASSVPQGSLLADYYPFEARGRVFALLGMVQTAAQLIALPLAGAAITFIGLRASFAMFGAPLTLMGVVAAIALRDPVRGYFERKAFDVSEEVARTEEEPRSFGEGWRTIWSVRTLRRFFVGNILTGLGGLAYLQLLSFMLAEVYGLNTFQRGLLGFPTAAAALIGGFLGGGLVDRFTRRNPGRAVSVYALFAIIAAFGMALAALQPPILVLAFGSAAMSFGLAMTGPAAGSIVSQVIPPDSRTLGIQIFGLAALPPLLFGTPIVIALFERYGYTTSMLAGLPLFIVGAVVIGSAGRLFDLDRRNAFAAAMASEEWRQTQAGGEGKLLVCRGVDVEYDGVQVLFGVDFDVEEGEIIALLGTNGAGKSTLLRAISGTQEASGGGIVFDGRNITHMPPHETARRGVIHVPGGRGVFPGLSVRDNLLLGTWMVEDNAERDRRLAEINEIFPVLAERAATMAGSLSGGEQQQLSLAQAFLSKPRLLMIDELSLGLSPAVVGELLEKVREIHSRGTTLIIVEQSVNVALTIANRAIFMEKGEVKFVGATEELLSRPDVLRAVYVKGTGALTEGPVSAQRSEGEQRRLDLERAAPVLELDGIVKRYGGVTALDEVSFSVAEGSVLGIIGPNGSGKTTLFDVISGFQRADAGTVRYAGEDITNKPPDEVARRKLVRRFQDARLFPSLTVYETLLVALDQRLEVRNFIINASALPQARRAERRIHVRADRLIDLLELGSYRDKFVKELSTGLRRIVDIACTLASDPKLLLLDEPSSGIAQAEAEGLAPLLRRVRHETGCTIMIIEHDMPLLSRVADELLALESGRFVTRGSPEVVLNDERVIQAYLGTSEEAVNRSGGLA